MKPRRTRRARSGKRIIEGWYKKELVFNLRELRALRGKKKESGKMQTDQMRTGIGKSR